MSWAGLEARRLMLDGVRSRDELLRVLGRAAEHGVGVLRAEKFDESAWADPRLPTIAELDRVTGPRPVFVRRVCGHVALVNHALLAELPADLAAEARETGLLRERPVLDFDRLVPLAPDELGRAFVHAEQCALREGVTAVCTMEPLVAARALCDAALRIDVRIAVFVDDLAALEASIRRNTGSRVAGEGGWRDRLFGVKLFLDGAIGARTAAMGSGYSAGQANGTNAELVYDDAALGELLVRIWELGLTPVAHAIGARAIEQLARVSLEAQRRAPQSRALGARIEHGEELNRVPTELWDPALHRLCMQPNFVRRWQKPGGLYEQRLPAGAAEGLNPFGAVLRRQLPLGFGSDGMPFGPRWGMAGATDHPLESERLSREQALRAYSLGAAGISGLPALAGPIEPGRRADLLVLSVDPLTVTDLAEAEVRAVIVRGELAWAAPDYRASSG